MGCFRNSSASSDPAPAAIAQPSPAPNSAAIAATPMPTCIVTPAQTEGPYFVDEQLNRSDIRDGEVGTPLQLTLRVISVVEGACEPMVGAIVDIWHCNALGVYSGVQDRAGQFNTLGQAFLRGYQVTDESGTVQFSTLYPGWYPGRAVHIHFKVRIEPGAVQGLEFTSQLYFQDAISDTVFAQEPYASRGQRSTRNERDRIYQGGGDQLTLTPTPIGDGFQSAFEIGLVAG
jgi:protocatechuate 3,4-dioxygenase beta subunit